MISFDPSWGPVICRKAGSIFNQDSGMVICRTRINADGGQDIMGGSVWTGYTGESMGVHVAGFVPNWMSRELIFITFGYPFLQLQCNRIFSQVPANNDDAMNYNLKMGFKEVARIAGVFRGGEDCIVMCMERHECRFLQKPKSCSQSNFQEEFA